MEVCKEVREIYVWYADVFVLINLCMDLTGLLATAVICSSPVRLWRIFAVSVGGSVVSVLILAAIPGIWYFCIIHLILNPFLIWFAFRPREVRCMCRMLLSMYLIVALAGGVQESLLLTAGTDTAFWILGDGILTAACFVLYQIRFRVLKSVCQVELWLEGRKITVQGYYDSGNLLRDPGTGKPVHILEQVCLPEEWRRQERAWISYETMNHIPASMEVITLDRMIVFYRGCVIQIEEPELGLSREKVMQLPTVKLLLHSSCLA